MIDSSVHCWNKKSEINTCCVVEIFWVPDLAAGGPYFTKSWVHISKLMGSEALTTSDYLSLSRYPSFVLQFQITDFCQTAESFAKSAILK